MKRLPFLLAMTTPFLAEASDWQLLSREEGCIPTETLVRGERLPHAPSSPEDLAAMLRAQGRTAEIVPVPGFPAEMAKDFVMVRMGNDGAPIFVRSHACARIDAGRH